MEERFSLRSATASGGMQSKSAVVGFPSTASNSRSSYREVEFREAFQLPFRRGVDDDLGGHGMRRYSCLTSVIGGMLLAMSAQAQHALTKVADVPMPGP